MIAFKVVDIGLQVLIRGQIDVFPKGEVTMRLQHLKNADFCWYHISQFTETQYGDGRIFLRQPCRRGC